MDAPSPPCAPGAQPRGYQCRLTWPPWTAPPLLDLSDGFYYWESVIQLQTLLLVLVDVFGKVLPVYQQAVLLQVREGRTHVCVALTRTAWAVLVRGEGREGGGSHGHRTGEKR